MAFSTQKDFLHVAFMNERPEPTCVRMEGVKLKTYASIPDERAWSLNKDKQTQYLIDLVACNIYPGDEGDGNRAASRSGYGDAPCSANVSAGPCGSRDPCAQRGQSESKDPLTSGIGDDSVLEVALAEISKLEKIVAEQKHIKSKLEVSQEKLSILKEEKQTIEEILNNEHYPPMSCQLQMKIEHLKCSCKIDKNDENELLKLLDDLHKREKAFEVLDAQNCYLRRLVEKLSLRGGMPPIPLEPEKCTDINYLQCEVDNLRKEVAILRDIEDRNIETEKVSRGIQSPPGSKDADNVAKIICERNALRDKCKHFAAIEGKICQWKHEAEQFELLRIEACCAIKKKDEEIQDLREECEELQFELKKIQKCCNIKNQEEETLCTTMDCLKDENRRLRDEICRCNCDLKRVTMLQNQVQCLSTELCEKNCIINQYDMQFQQLLGVVEDLQKNGAVDIRGLQDVDSQTHNDNIEELAVTTRATLDQISKELETRQDLENELTASNLELLQQKEVLESASAALKESFHLLEVEAVPGGNCTAQVEQLQEFIKGMKTEKENLEKQNKELLKSLQECQNKVQSQENDLKNLEKKTNDISADLRTSKAQVKEVDKLAKNINSVQERNENLSSVLEAVDYSSEIENLKRQLEQEKKKSADCQAKNQEMEKLKQQLEVEKKKSADCQAKNQEMEKLKQQLEEERKKNANLQAKNVQLEEEKKKSANSQAKNVQLEEEKKKSANSQPKNVQLEEEKKKSANSQAKNVQLEEEKKKSENSQAKNEQQLSQPVADGAAPEGAAALGPDGKSAKKASKLAQMQKVHETERNKYEKEIDGHRASNEAMRTSLNKLANHIQTKGAADLEREFRRVLDGFVEEICRWRCEKTCGKLTKLQEICKKILDMGISCLTYKELVYLHQQMSEAAAKLKPKALTPGHPKRELTCCKCSGDICQVPMIPKENEKLLLEKMAILEHDIQSARESLRKIKQNQDPDTETESEQMECDTLRPTTFRLNHGSRNTSARPRSSWRSPYLVKEDYEVPTKDRCGF